IQVGSALAWRSIPLQSAYCGAKAAIRGFTDAVRTDLMHQRSRIQLTMVQLPGMNTTQFGWARNKMDKEM
ncbi:SDR family NAD(P)-dependent oxidoreductase, partial [Klebsiella michiganensis]